MKQQLQAIESAIVVLKASDDPEVVHLRVQKEAEAAALRTQLKEEKPTKVKVQLAMTARDKALHAAQ